MLTLNNVVRPRANGPKALQHDIKHAGRAIGCIRRRRSARDADRQPQLLALVDHADRPVRIRRVLGRDALAAGVENGYVARHLVPGADVGAHVEGGRWCRVEA